MKKNKTQSGYVLVTGGAGYIGSACTKALLDNGYSVVVIDNLSRGNRMYIDPRSIFIKIDLKNEDAVLSVFSQYIFDYVIHFAALKSPEESERNPLLYFENNLRGTKNVLSGMIETNVEAIIFSSSAAVYDATLKIERYSEESPIRSSNTYGLVKIMEEELVMDVTKKGLLHRAVIFRYFNVAGDSGLNFFDSRYDNVFPILSRATNNETQFNIFGDDYPTKDGTPVRDYVHISDIVAAHIQALEQKHVSGILNLGTSSGYSVKELIGAFARISGKSTKIHIKPRRAGDPSMILADITKAKNMLGWEPKHSLDEMIVSSLKIYK